MILKRYQADGVIAAATAFWNFGQVNARIGVAVGITAFFVSHPVNIRLTRTGYPEENYTLIEDLRLAYANVL